MNDEPPAGPVDRLRFFLRVDWASFGITALLALAVYLFTLSSEVGLVDEGHYCVSSMYAGAADAPGFPIWTAYSWFFTRLPFSNIARRVALASAVAGALACGLIALMVSHVGILMVENNSGFKSLSLQEEKILRIVCSSVAGLGFGFDRCVWPKAVIADPWPLSLFLFALTLCLLTRWFFAPQQKRWLYAAAFVYGLTLCNSQAMLAAALGLLFVVAIGNRNLGREMFFGTGIFLWAVLALNQYLPWLDGYLNPSTRGAVIGLAIIATLMCVGLSVLTRRFASEWKAATLCAALVFLGLSGYLLLPVFSMANPPMNWGYPRTVEGFFHLITRGQYERPWFNNDVGQFITQLGIFGRIAMNEFGSIYLLAAIIPIWFLPKMPPPARNWLIAVVALFALLSSLLLVGLNPQSDRQSLELLTPFFAATHLVLAVLSGCGLMLLGTFIARSKPGGSPS